MSTRNYWTALIGCGMLIAGMLIAGCGKSSDIVKTTVSGNVKYNSEPIEKGAISFVPMEGTKGPMASTAIVNGEYQVTAVGGVPVGKHKVEIIAHRELPKPADAPPMAPTPRKQYIPEKYNTKTTLEVEVPAGKEFQHDIALEGPAVDTSN